MTRHLMRLKQRAEFLRVAATRKKWVTPGFILQVRVHRADTTLDAGTSLEAGHTLDAGETPLDAPRAESLLRVGFTVTRKVGNAVKRNRAKRRLRALAADILPIHAQGGFDLVFIGRRTTLKRPWLKLVRDLLSALDKMGVAHKPSDKNRPETHATGHERRRKPV